MVEAGDADQQTWIFLMTPVELSQEAGSDAFNKPSKKWLFQMQGSGY